MWGNPARLQAGKYLAAEPRAHAQPGGRSSLTWRSRWARLPGRCGDAVGRAEAVRAGRLRSGSLPADRLPGRGRVRAARGAARQRAWELAGNAAPGGHGGLVTVDIDARFVTSCSEKQQAMPTWEKICGRHLLTAFADHGAECSGEQLAVLLRAANAGSNTAADHIEAVRLALAQPPSHARRPGADPHRLRRRHP